MFLTIIVARRSQQLKNERPIPIWTETFPGVFRVWLGTARLDDEDMAELEGLVLDSVKEVTGITQQFRTGSDRDGEYYERLKHRYYFFAGLNNPDSDHPNVRYGSAYVYLDNERPDRMRVSVLYGGLGSGTRRKQVLDTIIHKLKTRTKMRFGPEPQRIVN